MDNIWTWYKKGNNIESVNAFISDLEKANKQGSILLKHQMLKQGDIHASASMLLILASKSPENIDKVLEAAIKIDAFCRTHHPQAFDTEELSISAMLETVKDQTKYAKSSSLVAKANLLITQTKTKLQNNPNSWMRDAYDAYLSSFHQMSDTFAKFNSKAPQKPSKTITI